MRQYYNWQVLYNAVAVENNVAYTDNNGMGEGWAIKAVGNNLVITGGVQRGTLYGVYHLLEDVFGVHWWNMWEEYVPEMEDAVDGAEIYGEVGADLCTVDNTHPNDLGFYCMAEHIRKVLEDILKEMS